MRKSGAKLRIRIIAVRTEPVEVFSMPINKAFKFFVLCVVAILFSGCEYFSDTKSLNFETVHVGFNGPDIGRESYYRMEKIYVLTDAESTQNSWLKTALTKTELEKIAKETDFKKKFLLLYLSNPISIANSVEIASVKYSNPSGRIHLNVFAYRNLPINSSISVDSLADPFTYPFTIAAVDKPKKPYIDFDTGGSYFEQNRVGKSEKMQTGIARTFEEVINNGAKLASMELLQLDLEQCLEMRKQNPKFCDEYDIKRMQKNIDIAIAHFDEATPTLEGMIKENLQICLEMKQKYGHVCDELSFSVKISNAAKTRQELLNRRRKE